MSTQYFAFNDSATCFGPSYLPSTGYIYCSSYKYEWKWTWHLRALRFQIFTFIYTCVF